MSNYFEETVRAIKQGSLQPPYIAPEYVGLLARMTDEFNARQKGLRRINGGIPPKDIPPHRMLTLILTEYAQRDYPATLKKDWINKGGEQNGENSERENRRKDKRV